MSRSRIVWIAAGTVLTAVFAYWAFAPRAVLVETATVEQRRFTAVVEEDGKTRIRDKYVVSAPIAGRLSRVALREGDHVKGGEAIAFIAPNPAPLIDARARQELEARVGAAQASAEEAQAMRERAEVTRAQSQSDLDRTRQLRARNVVPEAQLDRDTFALLSAESELVAADRRKHAAAHALQQAKSALMKSVQGGNGEQFPVSSPIDGSVLRIIHKSEGSVSVSTAILEVGDPADLEVSVDVLTSDAVNLRQGSRVVIERWGGANPLEGRVRRIEPSGSTKISALGVEEQRVWVIIDITSPRDDWAALGDGYRVDVAIVVEEIEDAIVVPVGALFRLGGAWHVYRVDAGRAHLTKVVVRRWSGKDAALSGGVGNTAEVVVYPPDALSDGARVRVD